MIDLRVIHHTHDMNKRHHLDTHNLESFRRLPYRIISDKKYAINILLPQPTLACSLHGRTIKKFNGTSYHHLFTRSYKRRRRRDDVFSIKSNINSPLSTSLTNVYVVLPTSFAVNIRTQQLVTIDASVTHRSGIFAALIRSKIASRLQTTRLGDLLFMKNMEKKEYINFRHFFRRF